MFRRNVHVRDPLNLSFQGVVPSLLSVVNRPLSDSRAASPDLISNGHSGDPANAVVTEIILVQQESFTMAQCELLLLLQTSFLSFLFLPVFYYKSN